jgi:hypothetical protein
MSIPQDAFTNHDPRLYKMILPENGRTWTQREPVLSEETFLWKYRTSLTVESVGTVTEEALRSNKVGVEKMIRRDLEANIRRHLFGDVFTSLNEIQRRLRDMAYGDNYQRYHTHQEVQGEISKLRRLLEYWQ